ncbi:MAG: hypothetical protein RCG15_00720 [Candidatus Rickettsia vulgarisii]
MPPPPPPTSNTIGGKEQANTQQKSNIPANTEQPGRDALMAALNTDNPLARLKKADPTKNKEKPLTEEQQLEKTTEVQDNLFKDPTFKQRFSAILQLERPELNHEVEEFGRKLANQLNKQFKNILGPDVIVDNVDLSEWVDNDKDRIKLKHIQKDLLQQQAQQIAGGVLSDTTQLASNDSMKTPQETIKEAGAAIKNAENQPPKQVKYNDKMSTTAKWVLVGNRIFLNA